ncbi:hypothetical protein [Rhodococcus sp. R1101]|uniref:hypothetical protein n=1 Tax=Rhodococcus sp. R1101 TaxID=1170698 RepID=UPI0012F66018|nr:hypothetical protein [Rhodococcus sp. R1101]
MAETFGTMAGELPKPGRWKKRGAHRLGNTAASSFSEEFKRWSVGHTGDPTSQDDGCEKPTKTF